jgi:hypothetical protein
MSGQYGALLLLGGIALVAVLITTLDWLAHRRFDRERKSQHH